MNRKTLYIVTGWKYGNIDINERTNNYFTILLDIGVNFYYLIDVLKGALKMTVNKISELNGRRSDALLSFDSLLFEV